MELISVRETARRIGVSDTAIQKGIKSGRVTVASRTESSNRPLLAWPQVKDDWINNSASQKRTHVGGTGKSARREKYAPTPPEIELELHPGSKQAIERGGKKPDPSDDAVSYANSRAQREYYEAELSRLEYETKLGKLVEADSINEVGRKLASEVIAGMYNIPERISDEIAGMTDANQIQALIIREIDVAVDSIRRAYAS